ncbi:long-chain-fatty-acid--CoA ligase [Thermodesulfobacteriota bacterium]
MKTLGEIPFLNAKYYPNKKAIVDGSKEFTWEKVNERINRLANALINSGCSKGDRLAILSYNCSEFIESLFACAKIGIMFVPLNFRLSMKEIDYILNDATPNTLIFSEELIDAIPKPKMPFPLDYIGIGIQKEGVTNYEALVKSGSSLEPSADVSEDDPLEILYTSGTTGFAKGVIHTHRTRIEGVRNLILAGEIKHEDVHLVNVPPLFHAAGYGWMLANAYMGARIIISGLRGFDPEATLETIQRESVTNLHMVPITIMELINFPNLDHYDFSSLRLIYYATAPMPAGPLRQAMDLFGNIFVQLYGLTEAGPTVSFLSKKDHEISGLSDAEADERLRSCGRPFAGVFVMVADDDDHEVPPHTVGEIIAKSGDIMERYWNKEEETNKTIKGGWLHTGDLGTYDEDHYFYLVDRKKDMVISGGENIYPAEVERVIYEHPAVAECAVIGVPDERWGEAVKALVVLRTGKQASEDEIIQFVKKSLASYKKPKTVEFLMELPRNPQGKVLKRILKEKYWGDRVRRI